MKNNTVPYCENLTIEVTETTCLRVANDLQQLNSAQFTKSYSIFFYFNLFPQAQDIKQFCINTCKSIDALAHRTALLTAENPLVKERFEPINLSGDEFTRIVTSSMPSFPIIDHPSSLNPLRASLKPLPQLH